MYLPPDTAEKEKIIDQIKVGNFDYFVNVGRFDNHENRTGLTYKPKGQEDFSWRLGKFDKDKDRDFLQFKVKMAPGSSYAYVDIDIHKLAGGSLVLKYTEEKKKKLVKGFCFL
jgi:hypothetical protein